MIMFGSEYNWEKSYKKEDSTSASEHLWNKSEQRKQDNLFYVLVTNNYVWLQDEKILN